MKDDGGADNPADELFDVVDESDVVIDTKPRRIVHRDGLLHRAVHIFLFRPDGRMLVHLRTDDKEEFPSVWTSSASGHVSSGENYAEAAQRELQEELGITAELSRVAEFKACAETSNEFTQLFLAESDEAIHADPTEIADTAWLTIDVIRERMAAAAETFSPAFRLLFEYYMDRNNTVDDL